MLISSLTCEYLCMAKPEGESEKNTCLPNIHHPLKKQEVGAKKTPLRHKLKIHVYFFPQENKMHQTPKTLNSLGLNTASSRLQILKWASKALQLIRADLHQNQHRSIPAVHLYHHSFLKVPSEDKTFLLFFFFPSPTRLLYFFLWLSSLLHDKPGTWLSRGGLIITITYL